MGGFVRDMLHGKGTLDRGSLGKYEGMWKLARKHGAGRTDYEDGGYFIGIYNEGVYKRGKLSTGNGDTYEGEFDDHGKFLISLSINLRICKLSVCF